MIYNMYNFLIIFKRISSRFLTFGFLPVQFYGLAFLLSKSIAKDN
jgi:hypothetical protein